MEHFINPKSPKKQITCFFLGIFSKNGHSLQKLQWDGEYRPLANSNKHIWSSDKLESFLPCLIDGTIPLLGVWTKKNDSSCFGYVGQLWMFLQIHKDKLNASNQIICGDFNSNSMWDKWDRWWNHSDVIEELKNIHLESVYHTKSGESQGEELSPTFFMQRNKSKGYHIDYFFLRKEMLEGCSFQVLNQSHWLKSSDHLPLQLIMPSHKISNGTF